MPRFCLHLSGILLGTLLLCGLVLAASKPPKRTTPEEEIRFQYNSHGRRGPFIPLIIPTPTLQPTPTATPYVADGEEETVRYVDSAPASTRVPPPKLPISAIFYGGPQSLLVMNDQVFTEGEVVPLDDGTTVRIVSIEPQQVRCLYFDEPFVVELPRARR